MAGNLPDGCIWPSDVDYYDAMNPVEREELDDFDWTEHEEKPVTIALHFNASPYTTTCYRARVGGCIEWYALRVDALRWIQAKLREVHEWNIGAHALASASSSLPPQSEG